jgi:threonine dehydrogenase-like Zn-dependent dehydrogenase
MNPWQEIPLADYEAHMNAEAVKQASVLSELFGEALALRKPASVAVLGVAGGNGLEQIDEKQTRRVAGVDLNPHYLAAVRKRFANMAGLELYAIDLAEAHIQLPPVELVHAALIFEHTGLGQCLENALALMTPEGALSVVLQLPGAESQNVGGSGVVSIAKLAADFSLIDPNALTRMLAERGLQLTHERLEPVPGGKQLWMGIFVRS